MDVGHDSLFMRLAGIGAIALMITTSCATTVAAPPETTTPATSEARPNTTPTPSDSAPATPEAPRILLTNDDGWSAGGLLALREVLLGAGFDVVVFAPVANQTGASATLTFGQPVTIAQMVSGVFSVDGSPADAVEVGLSLAFPGGTPDLVIAGPNPGYNIGNLVVHSGTVGAAVTALNEGVPAIAVNTGSDPQTGDADYTTSNAFVVDLVNTLVANAAAAQLLPDGLGLNVNIPLTANDEPPAGVAITTTDRGFVDADFAAVQLPAVGESVQATAEFLETPPVDPASDSAALEGGLVAITFIEGNYDAMQRETTEANVEALTPVLMSVLGG